MPYVPTNKRPSYLPSNKKVRRTVSESRTIHASNKWRRTSERQRNAQPLCQCCLALGHYETATQVDHIVRLTDGGAAFSTKNLMSICDSHHQDKNVMENKGYRPAAMRRFDGLIPCNVDDVIADVLRGYALDDEGNEPKGVGGHDLWIK